VTIYQLLTHTSGIHNYTDVPDFTKSVAKPVGQEALMKEIQGLGYDFNPGTAWRYSNSGYFILARIVELVSGESYGYFLKTHIFEPLGMETTGIYAKNVTFAHEAIGYSYDWSIFSPAVDWDMSWARGAGSLYSNVEDLCKWNEALFGGKVLSQPMMDLAFSPVQIGGKQADAYGTGYGYGWMIWTLRGLNVIGHAGGLDGFNSFLIRVPEEHFTVVALSNCAPPGLAGLNAGEAALQVAQVYLWKKMQNQPCYETHEIDPSALDDYAGRYDYGGGSIMKIFRSGNRLFTRPGGRGAFELFPSARDDFFWKVGEATISFERNAGGIVTTAVHRQGGTVLVAPRLFDRLGSGVNPAAYDSYLGKYQSEPGEVFTVTREGDKLYAQFNDQPKFEIFIASPEAEYSFMNVRSRISFVWDDTGHVRSLVLHQGEMPKTFLRMR
jgi:CubicO group peptidase (beta-lactamase class C family)